MGLKSRLDTYSAFWARTPRTSWTYSRFEIRTSGSRPSPRRPLIMDVNLRKRDINENGYHCCLSYFWKASLQPWGVSGCGRSWTPRAECEARAAMEERLEVTILVMASGSWSSSGGGDSDTEEALNKPDKKQIVKSSCISKFLRKWINIFTGDVIIKEIFTLST